MATIQLQPSDARIVALAIVYHLGRPGSELNAATLRRHELGLGPLQPAIESQLGLAEAKLELSPYQLSRLGEALLGTVNELKQHELSEGRSVVPGFAEALVRLFPEQARSEGGALDLASQGVLLRRRLDAAVREAGAQLQVVRGAQTEPAVAASSRRRSWWRFWGR